MARRKLNPFTADEAGDAFVPTVKTMKGATIPSAEKQEKKAEETEKKGPDSSAAAKKSKPVPAGNTKKAVKKPEESAVKAPVKKKIERKPPVQQEKKMTTSSLASDHLPAEAEMPVSEKKKESSRDEVIEMVGFQLGEAEFGIDIRQVQDINRMIEITTVPKAPHFVRGVMNLRGKVIPVLSMRSRFGLDDEVIDKQSRIIVVEVKGTIIGFIVDAVSEVLRVSASTIENTTDLVNWIDAEYIKGVAKHQGRLLVLIDLEKVLFNK